MRSAAVSSGASAAISAASAEPDARPLGALADRGLRGPGLLAAQADPLGGRAGGHQPAGELLALGPAGGQRQLRAFALGGDLGQRGVDLVARGARGGRAAASASARRRQRARASSRASAQRASRDWRSRRSCSSAASAWRLSGRSRPRASRSTSSARSRFSSVRSSLSWAPAAALAVLAEAGRLLDQQAAVLGLGGDDRLHAALGDDRVRLLAQAGVRERLEDVDQPAPRAVDAVLAVAGAVQAAHDRELGELDRQRAVGVVDDHLDLGGGAGLLAAGPAKDDVLHGLAAHCERGLLAHRPQHGVGDVRLARAVGPDDHADARVELQPRPVGERLEALEGDRLEVHQPVVRAVSRVSSAVRAASCSASFLVRPVPLPTSSPATIAAIWKTRSCGGPSSSTTL